MNENNNICPVTGKLCNRQKNFEITEIVEGKTKEYKLCQECAGTYFESEQMIQETKKKIPVKKKEEPKSVKASDALSNLLNSLTGQKVVEPEPEDQSCPDCGITLDEIKKNKRLGCPGCYDFFGETILSLIKKLHSGSIKHTGKVPKKFKEQKEKEEKEEKCKTLVEYIKRCNKKMDKAAKEEDYKLAAAFRDKIKELDKLMELQKEIKIKVKELTDQNKLEEALTLKKEINDLIKKQLKDQD